MAGPINGSGWFGKDALRGNAAPANIVVPTVVQMASDTLQMFSGLTCLYNKNWFNRQDMVSLPLAFFYIKSIETIMETEVSEKRVIVYDPQIALQDATAAALAKRIRPGVLEVIADNRIVKPKQYQLEIVLPFKLVPGLLTRGMNDLTNMFDAFGQIFGSQMTVLPYFASAQGVISLGNSALTSMAKLSSGSSSAAYINANSLEAMWQSGDMLTFKMWTGYDYKFVMITSLQIKKEAKEDDVFRASMRIREVPVLTVNPANDVIQPLGFDREWAATAIEFQNRALMDPFIALTGVKQASGA
jgi:hypothetical protein